MADERLMTAYCPICDKHILVWSTSTSTHCPRCNHHLTSHSYVEPIRITYEDAVRFEDIDDYIIKTTKHLTPTESEKLLMDLFGTTDVGILDCSDMPYEKIYEFHDEVASLPLEHILSAKEILAALENAEKNKETADA